MGQRQCCQQESIEAERLGEVQLCYDEWSYDTIRDGSPLGIVGDPDADHCRCLRNGEFPTESVAVMPSPLESLSYEPIRFDISQTVDVERSQARYTNIVVHSTRARTQRRSQAWEHWLRAATAGRPITLLTSFEKLIREGTDESNPGSCSKVSATYRLDSSLTKLSITANQSIEAASPVPPIGVCIDSIQVICPATDFMLFFDQVQAQLDDTEQKRAILLQYQPANDSQRKRICFLEESEHAKDRFVQALTALWLEKRSDHSMWF
mmetsp:Transcript_98004/g.184224  ORF Transcript_98004/g.184224 Transcript_98004/m.184224 type:complete len:265 (-) Transcript_98004:42-836(-)